jgi:methylmalonyl-CoA/ethylmalonyl-CoA epimerase
VSRPGRRLHHVGYVVGSIDSSLPRFLESMEAVWDGRIFSDPSQKVKVAFISTGEGDPLIELVEPDAVDAPVQRFLREKGGGLHHVCYEVEDPGAELTAMRSRGGRVVMRPKPAVAFDGRQIAWVLTREDLLVELLEKIR